MRNFGLKIKAAAKRPIRLSTVCLLTIAIAIGFFIAGTRSGDIVALFKSGQNSGLPQDLDLSSLQEIYDELRERYDGTLNTEDLINGAKKGLVSATGDPYTVYFTDEEAQEFSNDLDGKFSGIGAELGSEDGNLVIVSVLDDSPAEAAGLQAGDIIAEVNDEETTGWSIDQAVSTIRGDKGTTVKLTIVRDQEVKEFSIVRDDIVNPSVTYEITDDNIGYMRISRFADDTISLAEEAASEFVNAGVSGVVLDLRGDGGGYLTTAQDVAGLWLPSGEVIVQERVGNVVQETLESTGSAPLKDIPTVVLIDEGSASASEIVAGALHDYGVATLVGTTTYGKGSVQELIDLPLSGGQLKVTVAKWYTPNGDNIDGEGISPDVEVDATSDTEDTQLQKAIELLKS